MTVTENNSPDKSDGVYVKLNGELTKVCPIPPTGFGQTDIKWINHEPAITTTATTYNLKEMNWNGKRNGSGIE